MKATLTEMHSILDAIRTLYMSKRSWTPEKEEEIRKICEQSITRYGKPVLTQFQNPKFSEITNKLFKYGQRHITMLRFLDMSVTVEGLHRGATDDFDAHAKRLENRIIRSSTRLADYSDEMSEWYEGKILPYDRVFNSLNVDMPDSIDYLGDRYVRTINGYIREDLVNNRDVKRGLYMLSIPMTFTFKVNIIEFAHIYKERGSKIGGANGTAAPELQDMIESLADQLEEWYSQLTRDYLLGIRN